MKHIIAGLLLLLLLLLATIVSSAFAQSGVAVKQSGNVTPNQVPYWVTSGVIGDNVSSADSPVTSFGVTNNGGNGICVNSARSTAAGRVALCLGASTNSNAVISVQNYGTASAQGFNVNINGTIYPFPGAVLPSITIGTTAVTGGVNGYFLYNNAGVLGNYNLFGTANTWSQPQTVTAPVSATLYKIGTDIVLTHPLTPSADNIATTLITLGVGAGANLAPIHSTQYDTLIGYNAGGAITTADHITAVGAFALAAYTVSTASPGNQPSLTAVGIDAMRSFTTGQGNSAFGEHTMTANTTISDSVAVGNGAMFNSGGIRNTAVGVSAMLGAFPAINYLSGNDNVAVGSNSLVSIGTTSSTNTAVGSYALSGASLTQANTAVGYFACATVTTGSFNTCIGQAAGGTTLVTGSQNILIGLGADTPTASTSSYLNIGGWIFGDAANNVKFVGSIGTKVLGVLTGASGTVGNSESAMIISSGATYTVTLPAPASWLGRWLLLKNVTATAVSSASANISPLDGSATGTAILSATAGKWAWMQSDGSVWAIMAGN